MKSQKRKMRRSHQQAMSSSFDFKEDKARSFERRLLADLRSCHEEGLFNDCTLVCDNSSETRVKMNSIVLSMRSPMLKRLLLTDLKEEKDKVVKVSGVDEQCFHNFVHYFLDKPPNLENEDLDQAIQLYVVADYYQMDELKTICVDVLVGKVHFNNICQLTRLITFYGEPKLKLAIKNCFNAHMNRIESRKDYKMLLKDHKEFIIELLTDKIVIIGGLRHYDSRSTNSVLAFDPLTGDVMQWKSLRMPRMCHMAGCIYGGKIIICGGTIGDSEKATNEVEIIERNSETTLQGPPMNVKRRGAGSAVLDEHFYVFGGMDENGVWLSSCERYSFQANRWELLQQQMPVALYGCSAVAHDHYIFIIGGGLDYGVANGIACSSLYRYNTLTGQWTSMKAMSLPRCLASCTWRQKSNKILVTGGGRPYDEGMKCSEYDVDNDTWQEVADMQRQRIIHSLIEFNDAVYAIGGRGEDSIEKWEENTGQWQIIHTAKLPNKLCFFAAVKF